MANFTNIGFDESGSLIRVRNRLATRLISEPVTEAELVEIRSTLGLVNPAEAFNVRAFGALGDGATDDTDAFLEAIDAIPAGKTLFVPNGTYMLDGLTVAKDINIQGIWGSTRLKHIGDSATDMITASTPQTGFWQGLIFDGNGANQTVDNWFSLLHVYAKRLLLDKCIFTGSCFAGLRLYALEDFITVRNCEFLDPRQSLETIGNHGSLAYLSYSGSGKARALLTGCTFKNSSIPSVARLSGSGAAFSAGESGFFSVDVRDCWFENLGVRNNAGNKLSPLDFYNDVNEISVTGCTFINTMAQPDLRVSDSGNVYIAGNRFFGTKTAQAEQLDNKAAIAIQPSGNQEDALDKVVIIEGNAFYDYTYAGDEVGRCMYIQSGRSNNPGQVIIRNNFADNVAVFCRLNFESSIETTWQGDIELSHNVIRTDGNASNRNTVHIGKASGTIDLNHNTVVIPGGNAVAVALYDEINEATVRVHDNNLSTEGAQVLLVCRGAKNIFGGDNLFNRADGGTTHQIYKDPENNTVKLLHWKDDLDVNAAAGAGSYTWADIEEVRGRIRANLTATPEGLINARPGACEIISTGSYQNGYHFRKTQGGALGNTGWIVSWSRNRIDQNAATATTVQNNTDGTAAAALFTAAANNCQANFGAWPPAHTSGGNSHLARRGGFHVESTAHGIAISAKHADQDIRVFVGNNAGAAIERFRFDQSQAAGESPFWLYDGANLKRVKMGADGSGPGGTGRALYIDNA